MITVDPQDAHGWFGFGVAGNFAGHLAHNVNLRVKAICGLGSFAKLCEMLTSMQRPSI